MAALLRGTAFGRRVKALGEINGDAAAACCPVDIWALFVSVSENLEKTDLFDAEADNDCWVRSRRQVLSILAGLRKKLTTVTAYFDDNRSFILTAVLDLLADRDLMILDEGPSEEHNLALLRFGQASCVTVLDRIRIRFDCANLEPARYQGRSVLVCPIPKVLFYLQRRECFRVATSVAHPPLCYVPQSAREPLKLLVVDISAGGLGLHNPNRPIDLETQHLPLYSDCRLYLPDFADLTVDLQLKNAHPAVRKDGTEVQKIGAKFMNLTPGAGDHIQQYVNNLQLKHIATTQR